MIGTVAVHDWQNEVKYRVNTIPSERKDNSKVNLVALYDYHWTQMNPTIGWVCVLKENNTSTVSCVDNIESKIDNLWEEKLFQNIDQLNYILSLEKNWDYENSDPIDECIVSKVQNIIGKLDYQPTIFPTGRNSIQLEFFLRKNYLEFEIFNSKIVKFIKKDGLKEEKIIETSEIYTSIKRFYET